MRAGRPRHWSGKSEGGGRERSAGRPAGDGGGEETQRKKPTQNGSFYCEGVAGRHGRTTSGIALIKLITVRRAFWPPRRSSAQAPRRAVCLWGLRNPGTPEFCHRSPPLVSFPRGGVCLCALLHLQPPWVIARATPRHAAAATQQPFPARPRARRAAPRRLLSAPLASEKLGRAVPNKLFSRPLSPPPHARALAARQRTRIHPFLLAPCLFVRPVAPR